jgi:hypothetical protein
MVANGGRFQKVMSAETMPLLASPAILNIVGSMMPTAPTNGALMSACRDCATVAGHPDELDAEPTIAASTFAALKQIPLPCAPFNLKGGFYVQFRTLDFLDRTMLQCPYCTARFTMNDLIESMVEVSDVQLRDRLSQYMHTLAETGVSADFLVVCANEFIKEQTNPDRRYSGC